MCKTDNHFSGEYFKLARHDRLPNRYIRTDLTYIKHNVFLPILSVLIISDLLFYAFTRQKMNKRIYKVEGILRLHLKKCLSLTAKVKKKN